MNRFVVKQGLSVLFNASKMQTRMFSSLSALRQKMMTKKVSTSGSVGVYTIPQRNYGEELVVSDSALTADKPSESNEYSIDSFGLTETLTTNLKKNFNITHLFPIQAKVMQPIMSGQDVIGKSKTGTGKTLAFLLPLIDSIVREDYPKPERGGTKILIMEPTRELANQVARELEKLDPRIRVATVYGGSPYEPQVRAISNGCHVIVATPGRLIDHVNSNTLDLSTCKYVVLDEADEMLRVGFAEAIESIMGRIEKAQTVLFSATMPKWIASIALKYIKNYAYIDCAVTNDGDVTPNLIKHKACMFPKDVQKVPEVIISLLNSFSPNKRCIIFSSTKAYASELENSLNHTMREKTNGSSGSFAAALHGDISQANRENILSKFRNGRLSVLVATDVAARGIDIPDVDLVLQLGIPSEVESYIHRSGRTGRAGKTGTCVVLYNNNQRAEMGALSAATGVKFSQVVASDIIADGIPKDVIKKTVKSINKNLNTIETKIANHEHALNEVEEDVVDEEGNLVVNEKSTKEEVVSSTAAALEITETLLNYNSEMDLKKIITSLVDQLLGVQHTNTSVQPFSILSSNLRHTTVLVTNPNASVRQVIDTICKSLDVDAGSLNLNDWTQFNDGVLFDVSDDIAQLMQGAMNRGELQEYGFPQKLPGELFQRRAMGGRGGFGGNSRGGNSRGGFGGERKSYGGDRSSSYGGDRSSSYGGERKSYGDRSSSYGGDRSSSYGGERKSYGGDRSSSYGGDRSSSYGGERKSYGSGERSSSYGSGDRSSYGAPKNDRFSGSSSSSFGAKRF